MNPRVRSCASEHAHYFFKISNLKFIFSLLVLFYFSTQIIGQEQSKIDFLKSQISNPDKPQPGQDIPNKGPVLNPDERCGVMYMQEMMEYMRGIENGLLEENTERANQVLRNPDFTRAITTIPVVVHVIHNGEAVGMGANISDAQILSQIQVLNEDFTRMNADAANTPGDFTGVAANVELEFCMATVDPDGNAINGIDRYDGGQASYSIGNMETSIKPLTAWNPEYYFNIWVAPLEGGLLGYAQFPEASGLAGMPPSIGPAGPDYTDGIVVRDIAFGTTGTAGTVFPSTYLGRVATHEAGHFWGLRHVWGDGDCSVDDFCGDTPTTGGNNGGLGAPCTYPGPNSCNDGMGDLPDMFQNYMDYTDDVCMNLFTADQKARVNVVLTNSPRRNYVNSMVCQGVQPPAWDPFANAPANDLCMNAEPINCGDDLMGTTTDASPIGTPADCGTPIGSSGVWYTFTGDGSEVTLSTCNQANYDTKINVYAGDCSTLACIDGNDDGIGCAGFTSELTINSCSGVDYYVYVNGFGGATGDFTLSMSCVAAPPSSANAVCSSAIPIACGDSVDGTTIGACQAGSPPDCFTAVTSPGVWYTIQGTGEFIELSTCNQADYDTKITVYSGSCGAFVCEAGNDDDIATCGFDFTSIVTFYGEPGTDYYAYVSGFLSLTGNFTLSATCIPAEANNLCMDATFIDCGGIYNGSNVLATVSPLIGNTDCNADFSDDVGPGVWYYFQAAGDNMVTLSTCDNASYDTKIDVYTGDDCDNLVCVAGNDDGPGCSGFTSELTFAITGNEFYYIYVSGFTVGQSTSRGDFTLSMTCARPIPTLSQWGIMILGLLILIIGLVTLTQTNIIRRYI